MSIQVRNTYNEIVERLQELDDYQLNAIHTIIVGLAKNSYSRPLGISTDEQLWAHIDHSVAQADSGIGEDADVVIEDLMGEFTL